MESKDLNPFLVVGLGNPKDSYVGTRHNIGRDFIGSLSQSNKSFEKSRKADLYRNSAFLFARLHCFMNESGPPIKQILHQESLNPKNLVVIVDDFMIPFGSLRLRPKGSAGGHNGLKSIIEVLGTEEFGRLRVGVGPVPPSEDPGDYVLKKFSKQERSREDEIFEIIQNGLTLLQKEGFQKAMGEINKQHFS